MRIPIPHLGLMTTLVMLAGIIIATNAPLTAAKRKSPPPPPSSPTPAPPPKGPVHEQFHNMFDFIKFCAFYMHVFAPKFVIANEKCCAIAQKVNIPLFCKLLFVPQVDKVFSPKNVVRVAKQCKKPLPIGSICGMYIVRNKTMIQEELIQSIS